MGLFRRKPAAPYRLDDERNETTHECVVCAEPSVRIKGFVHRHDVAVAAYLATCHDHDGREVFVDVILGTWGIDNATDHVTFGIRVVRRNGKEGPAGALVDAATVYDDSPIFGTKLGRADALEHERLPEVWPILDHVLLTDAAIEAHIYG